MRKLFIAALFMFISLKLKSQDVYHFPKAENWSLSGDCYDELHAIEKKAETRTLQYEADVADYKKGRFCSDCKRSAGQIERETHVTFAQHIAEGATSGRTIMAATNQMYADLYKAYRSDWDPLKSAYDLKAIECQGKVKTQKEINRESLKSLKKKFSYQYDKDLNQLSVISDPKKKTDVQEKLNRLKSSFDTDQQLAEKYLAGNNNANLPAVLKKLDQENDTALNLENDMVLITQAEPVKPSSGKVVTTAMVQSTTYQQKANGYAAANDNNPNEINKSLNLSLAKINATAAGNKIQAAQIQQQQNAELQKSVAGLTSMLNDMITRNSDRRADERAYVNEDEDKAKRSLLYACILNYSHWYMDQEIFMQTASSAISYRTGQPDFWGPWQNRTDIDEIKQYINEGDLENFYSILMLRKNIIVSNFTYDYPYREDFQSLYTYSEENKNVSKEVEKRKKKAVKGDIGAAFDLFCYYLGDTRKETDPARAEVLKNADTYMDIILTWYQHNYLRAQLTPFLQCVYQLKADNESNLTQALAYRQKIDSLFDPKAYSVFPEKILPYNLKKYYSDEFYYYLYFLNGLEKIKIYYQLYHKEGATPAKNKEYFALALQEYLNIGENLKIIFQDKKLQRPFTHDMDWNKNHPELNH